MYVILYIFIKDVTDLKDLPNPLSKVTSGLISNNKSVRIPLKAVHIRAKVIDMVAKVILLIFILNF